MRHQFDTLWLDMGSVTCGMLTNGCRSNNIVQNIALKPLLPSDDNIAELLAYGAGPSKEK